MIVKHKKNKVIVSGPKGEICITNDDKIAYRFIMLIEEACESKSALEIAKKYGFSLSRFKQIKKDYKEGGAEKLSLQKTGPKTNYRRTENIEKKVIHLRYLDNEMSPEVIKQRLEQDGYAISVRSINRIIENYGLQKKGFLSSILKKIKRKKKQ